jgi:hypothetical protein
LAAHAWSKHGAVVQRKAGPRTRTGLPVPTTGRMDGSRGMAATKVIGHQPLCSLERMELPFRRVLVCTGPVKFDDDHGLNLARIQ